MSFLPGRRRDLHFFCLSMLAVITAGVQAQQAASGTGDNLVFLDAAHGGADLGARLGGALEEKELTLRMTSRMRAALIAKGFSVITSRDGDQTLGAEQRAGLANHVRPLACILLHASSSAMGTVLAVAALNPDAEPKTAPPWGSAQAAYVSQSLALREGLSAALTSNKMKTILSRASTPPLDSLTCPGVTLELAGNASVDEGYQAKVIDGVTRALLVWKAQALTTGTMQAVGTTAVKVLKPTSGTGAER